MTRRAVRVVLPLVLIWMSFIVLPISSSFASDLPSAITSIKIVESTAGRWAGVTVAMTFSIPASAKPGDTFSAVLPTSLIAQNQTFAVRAPDGSLVATAVVRNGVATFTLSTYVMTHDDVTGVADARAHFDQNQVIPGQANDFDFHSGTTHWHSTVDIGAPISADHTVAYKIGYWTNGEDQGASGLGGAVTWRIYSKAGPWNTLAFHDNLGLGQVNDCASITVVSATTYRADGSLINPVPLGSRATVACTPGTVDVSIGAVGPAEVVRVGYTTTITQPTQTPFANAVDVVANGITVPKSWAISHYAASGSASGVAAPTTPATTTPATTTPATTHPTTTHPATTHPTTTLTTTATTTPAARVATTAPTTAIVVLGTAVPVLPFTGSPTMGLAEAGGLMLLIGSGLVLLGRRRRGLYEG